MAMSKEDEQKKVNELLQADMISTWNYHILYVTFTEFRKGLESGLVKCEKLKVHLTNLCKLYGLWELLKDTAPVYDCGYFGKGTIKHM